MKTIKIFFGAMLLMFFIASCKPEYVAPDIAFGDSYAGIDGTWKLSTFTQTDLLYKAVTKPSLDLKSFWTKGGNAYTITFNKTAKTYTTTGDVRVNYLGATGAFAFDNDNTPSALILTPTGGQPMKLKLLKPIRAEYKYNLEVSQDRLTKGKASVAYNYVFTK